MPTIRPEAQVSPADLLDAVDQLGTAELDRFVSLVLALWARRKAPTLPPDEAALLVHINRGLPPELRDRLARLDERREAETLTPEEQAELLRLVAQLEELEAQRVESLSSRARLRGVPLGALMAELGIRPPPHG